MRLDSYSAVTFAGRQPSDLAPALAAWVIGADPALRAARIRKGVRPEWEASSLLATEDLNGLHGCIVRSRWSSDRREHILQFAHRDDDDPSVRWVTTFRLTARGDDTLLESAVARDAPRGARLEPKAFGPRVVMDLLSAHDDAVRPRELTLPALQLVGDQDVVDFMELVLLEPARTVPVVVIARDVYGNGSAVDLKVIERRMQGMAVVATLDGRSAVAKFEAELADRGLGQALRCFNGAVHTYGATSEIAQKHRLWLRPSIEALPEEIRSDYVGETLARHLSLDCAPPSFVFSVEDFDRRERRREVAGQVAVPDLRRDLSAAEELLADAAARQAEAEESAREAAQRLQQAELEASTERRLREAFQAQLAERSIAGGNDALRESLRAVVCRQASPKQALEALQYLFPERLAVLPEALASAEREGARFRRPAEVLDLLLRLATTYYDALRAGGDAQAHKVFSKSEYASKGSEGEMNSASCLHDRSRVYKGRKLVMWPHLRAGGTGAAEDCLRIHFAWFAEEARLVIGHCGAHLSEV